jgi:hypothetical protein
LADERSFAVVDIGQAFLLEDADCLASGVAGRGVGLGKLAL